MNSSQMLLLPLCLGAVTPGLQAQGVVQLDPFTVTAQKRVQTVSDVPVPITVYTGEFLQEHGVTDYLSLAPFVPGLFVQEQSPNNPGINLRGITTDSGDPRSEARISIFQDGVSISRSRASVVELFDLDRVEVLKGPQGTLFGRGAEIGAISIVQRKARNESTGSLLAGFGSDNAIEVSGHVNAPILTNQLFGRFAFAWNQHDGTIENLADGSDLNGREMLAFRGSLRWQPVAQTTFDLIANWQHDTPPGTSFKSGVIPTSRGDTNPFTAAQLNRGGALGLDRTVGGITGILEHEFSKEWSLTSITGWREYDAYEDFDADGAGIYLLEFAEDARGRQFSQEVRLNFKHDRTFSGFIGAGYFDEKGSTRVPFYTDERQLWPFLSGTFRDALLALGLPPAIVNAAVPVLNPFVPQPTLPQSFVAFGLPILPPQIRQLALLAGTPLLPYRADEYTQTGETTAWDFFADASWRATDRLEFTAGVRYTQEDLTSGYQASNGSPATLGFIVNNIPGYPYLPTNGQRTASDDSSSWDGRAIARYEFTKTLNAFFSVARGHRPQSLLLDSTTTTSVQEETVMNYELGLKGSLSQGRVQWSAGAFHYDYKHFQTTVLSLGSFRIEDAGNATGEGFEAGLQGRLNERLSVFANYAFTDATFDDNDDDGRPQQYAGYAFRLTSRHAYTIGGTFTTAASANGRFFITPSWSYKSEHYFEDNNSSYGYGLKQGSFGIADLRIGWRSPKSTWEVTAYARNLFDEEFLVDAGNTGGSFGIPTYVAGQPQRIGVQAGLKW